MVLPGGIRATFFRLFAEKTDEEILYHVKTDKKQQKYTYVFENMHKIPQYFLD